MDGIHEILNSLYLSSNRDVLATIVRVDGSAYRKEGTSMLFKGDGTQIGLLSANCLETDLSFRVDEVLESGTSQTLVYDMRAEDDLSWGQGAGCNGVIHVLLEPIDSYLYAHLCKLRFYLDTGYKVTVIKKMTEENTVSDYLFIVDHQEVFGKWQGEIPKKIRETIKDEIRENPTCGIRYCQELFANLYIQTYQPKPRLIVFGAGFDSIPLVRFAAQAGFTVIVSDWRTELCNQIRFPDAEQIVIGFPDEVMKKMTFTPFDSVLIITHQFQRDKELLWHLKNQKLLYLGVLGSKVRTERLLGVDEIPAEIRSPVGLSIGAEGPEQIAISIVAELIQYQKKNTDVEKSVLL